MQAIVVNKRIDRLKNWNDWPVLKSADLGACSRKSMSESQKSMRFLHLFILQFWHGAA